MNTVTCSKCGEVIELPARQGSPDERDSLGNRIGEHIGDQNIIDKVKNVNQITGAPSASPIKGNFEPVSTITGNKGVVVSRAVVIPDKPEVVERMNTVTVPPLTEASVKDVSKDQSDTVIVTKTPIRGATAVTEVSKTVVPVVPQVSAVETKKELVPA